MTRIEKIFFLFFIIDFEGRVEQLLDPGTPWLEFSPLAAWEMYPEEKDPSQMKWLPGAYVFS